MHYLCPSVPLNIPASPVEVRCLENDSASASEHAHSGVELILNLGSILGAVVWRSASGEIHTATIDANHCCLIPAGVRHFVDGLRPQGLVSLLVERVEQAGVLGAGATEVLVESIKKVTAHDSLAPLLVSEFGRILGKNPHVLLTNAVGVTLAVKLLESFLSLKSGYEKRIHNFSPAERKRVEDYIRLHWNERIVVTAFSRHLSMSRTHFTRRFHATYGMAPLQYALKLKVDRALELIGTGNYRVAEAAYEVGFCDQSHLDRHCRKFYGRPPRALQRGEREVFNRS